MKKALLGRSVVKETSCVVVGAAIGLVFILLAQFCVLAGGDGIDADISNMRIKNKTYRPGEYVHVSVMVENTGNTKHTFYVGCSMKDPRGEWHHAGPFKIVTLPHKGSERMKKVHFNWIAGFPTGRYLARTAVRKKVGDAPLDQIDKPNAFRVSRVSTITVKVCTVTVKITNNDDDKVPVVLYVNNEVVKSKKVSSGSTVTIATFKRRYGTYTFVVEYKDPDRGKWIRTRARLVTLRNRTKKVPIGIPKHAPQKPKDRNLLTSSNKRRLKCKCNFGGIVEDILYDCTFGKLGIGQVYPLTTLLEPGRKDWWGIIPIAIDSITLPARLLAQKGYATVKLAFEVVDKAGKAKTVYRNCRCKFK